MQFIDSNSFVFGPPNLTVMMDFRHAVFPLLAPKPWGTLYQLASGMQIISRLIAFLGCPRFF